MEYGGEMFLAVQNCVGGITKDFITYVLCEFQNIYLRKQVVNTHEASGSRDSNERVNIGAANGSKAHL